MGSCMLRLCNGRQVVIYYIHLLCLFDESWAINWDFVMLIEAAVWLVNQMMIIVGNYEEIGD